MRIVSESLALQVSVPRFSKSDLERLRGHVGRLDALQGVTTFACGRQSIARFHLALVAGVNERLIRTIREMYDDTERYRSLYIKEVPLCVSIAATEHKNSSKAVEFATRPPPLRTWPGISPRSAHGPRASSPRTTRHLFAQQ